MKSGKPARELISWIVGEHVIGENSMKKDILTLTTCAFIVACGVAGANAEESMGDRGHEYHGTAA